MNWLGKKDFLKNKHILISLRVIMIILILLLLIISFNRLQNIIHAESFEDYKHYSINETLNKEEFIEETSNQNAILRNRVDSMRVNLAENNLLIKRLLERLNSSQKIETNSLIKISRNRIYLYRNKIIIYVDQPFLSTFNNSKSMHPFINMNALGLEIKPKTSEELYIGDIIAFKSKVFNISIIHRIIEIGEDDEGWYAVTKGDNNNRADPGKVRFEDINGMLVGLIY